MPSSKEEVQALDNTANGPYLPVRMFQGGNLYFLVVVEHDWEEQDVPITHVYVGERTCLKINRNVTAYIGRSKGLAPFNGNLLVYMGSSILQSPPEALNKSGPSVIGPSWHSYDGESIMLRELPIHTYASRIHFINEDEVMIE